jgi:site-specific DNA-methyltransferase (adenine-specific)
MKPGHIKPFYNRDGIILYHGDCLEVMPQLEGPFDAIISDPPFGTTACKWDTIIPFESMWEQYERLVRRNGAIVLFGSQPFTSALVMSNVAWFKYEWIWQKNKCSNFLQANFQPLKRHENILVFSQGHITYTPKNTPMMYNPIMTGVQNSFNKGQGTDTSLKSWKARRGNDYTLRSNENDGQFPKSIVEFSCDTKSLHPTQKPVELLEYLVKTYTSQGDIVLDNCFGSGTTAIACQNTNRRFVGIEQKLEYIWIAAKRIEENRQRLNSMLLKPWQENFESV